MGDRRDTLATQRDEKMETGNKKERKTKREKEQKLGEREGESCFGRGGVD